MAALGRTSPDSRTSRVGRTCERGLTYLIAMDLHPLIDNTAIEDQDVWREFCHGCNREFNHPNALPRHIKSCWQARNKFRWAQAAARPAFIEQQASTKSGLDVLESWFGDNLEVDNRIHSLRNGQQEPSVSLNRLESIPKACRIDLNFSGCSKRLKVIVWFASSDGRIRFWRRSMKFYNHNISIYQLFSRHPISLILGTHIQ